MREITPDSLSKLAVKKTPYVKATGQDIIYTCTACGYTEKEYALTSRNQKVCGRCSHTSIKSSLMATFNWVESDIQPPDYTGE
jgi:ribosomal protein S27AE